VREKPAALGIAHGKIVDGMNLECTIVVFIDSPVSGH
jgi:hypothetical protein